MEKRRGRPPKKRLDREKLKASVAVHPGVPQHERINMMFDKLIDELCDELG